MNKAIFFDRDGVLNKDPGYVHKVKDFELYDGAVEALKRLKEFRFFIISNQSGIGRGYYKEEDFHKFNNHVLEGLKKHNIEFKKSYFCPHTKEMNCECRKPSPKFIKDAEKEFNLDLKKSWMVGDHASDIGAGKNAGCKTVYLLTGHGVKHLDEARTLKPEYIAAK